MKLTQTKEWYEKAIALEQDCEVGAGNPNFMTRYSDPYIEIENCVERLWTEYQKHQRLIIALDFDDTIFDFHNKGFRYPQLIHAVKKCYDLGFHIVIFTASQQERYPAIRDYCNKLGLIGIKINENAISTNLGKNGKIYYNLLLDDRAGLGEALRILQCVLSRIENNYEDN